MKKYFASLLLFVLFSLQGRFAQSQDKNTDTDTLTQYYTRLAESTDEADHALLRAKLYALLKSKDEKDWITARNFFYRLKETQVVDSILKAEKITFPEGYVIRNEQVRIIYDAKSATEKEKLYKEWIKRFPPEEFGDERIIYDYARNSVATAYAQENNPGKAIQYANMIETQVWKGEGWAGIARVFIRQNQHLEEAKKLLQKAIANAYAFMTIKKEEHGAGFAATGYPGYCRMYAQILYKEENYKGALEYVQKAYKAEKDKGNVKGSTYSFYARILEALNRNKEAFDKIDEALHDGKATPDMKESLEKLYKLVNGSDAGYEDYLAKVNEQLYENFMKTLPRKMINQPAPAFSLKDINGNTVALSDYKGKIVILDFWATWCGPCKASFPSMKMAINKYKNDPEVQFLFIHTWEREDSTKARIKDFLATHKYPFEVLLDLKDAQTGTNKVVESYKVRGIPTKFVIDGAGNIRFRFTGFAGGNDAAVEELSAMITLVKRQS